MKEELIGNFKKENGQSVLEILIALSILVVSVSAGTYLVFQSQSFSVDTGLSQQAIYISHQAIEKARAVARTDFNSLISSSSTIQNFLQETNVENIDSYTKKVVSRVSWKTEPLRSQKIEFVTLLTNWKAAVSSCEGGMAGGCDGGSGLSGDWKNPRTLSSIDIGPGNAGTDLVVRSKIVYMTGVASDRNKPDFFIIDATNPSAPVIKGSVNTGPGLNTVKVSGNYAYVGNRDSNAQLQIIDISDITNPVLKKSYKLPDVSGNDSYGDAIFINGNKLYMGTKENNGKEFEVIDITDPLNPNVLGSNKIGGDIAAIYAENNFVYLATSLDNRELLVLDVSDPAHISTIGSFDVPGDEKGKSIFLNKFINVLYLGRIAGTDINHPELTILDVSSSSRILNLGYRYLAADLNDLVVRDYLAFLATSDSNKEFQVWNVSDPANTTLWSFLNFPQVATGIDYEDNFVYVSVRSNDALRIITSAP